MLNDRAGWGFEFGRDLLRTLDGGQTWREVTPPQTVSAPMGFFAFDPNFAWTAIPTDGGISFWHTTDGGAHWAADQGVELSQLETGSCGTLTMGMTSIRQLYFTDSRRGWLVATTQAQEHGYIVSLLFATQNGGQTWALRSLSTRECGTGEMPDGLNTVFFKTPERGWGGFFPVRWSYFPYNQQRHVGGWDLYQTTDGGIHWQAIPLPAPPGFLELVQRSENEPYNAACGLQQIIQLAPEIFKLNVSCFLYATASDEQQYVYLTTTGGQSWQVWPATGNEEFFADVYAGDRLTGWRLERSPGPALNNLQISTDAGQTWTTFKKVAWEYARFDFVSEQEGWAIVTSDQDALVHTRDGGQTWEILHPVIGK